ncbi:MAG: iron-sulfur cluster assembly scaffold protein [Anaerolineae bacterium]|jgi:nitrogen fixation NifU-like protein
MAEQQIDGLDRLVAELQEEANRAAQEVYSPVVIEHALQPKNLGSMLEPDGLAIVRGPCGDTMAVFLRINGRRIEQVTFLTDGCGPTLACGSMLTNMVQGWSLEQAAALEAADLIIALDGLPPENVHCAVLAVTTLQQAVAPHLQDGAGALEKTGEETHP